MRIAATLLTLSIAVAAAAHPEYAKRESVPCGHCHINIAAGIWGYRGLYYKLHNRSFARFDTIAEAKLAGVSPEAMGPESAPTNPDYPNVKVPPALDFVLRDLQGKPIRLTRYEGNVVLVVNLGGKELLPYARLEKLYAQYKDKGLVLLAFPSDAKALPKLSFPVFATIAVTGEGQAPLYSFLTSKATNPRFSGPVEASFTAFVLSRRGEVVARLALSGDSLSPQISSLLERELNAPYNDARQKGVGHER